LYKVSKLLLRFPHQFDRKKMSIGDFFGELFRQIYRIDYRRWEDQLF
jgi:hypothetical protein